MARLLRGYTDLLQPVNLLPDVLAGGGGYPLSQHYDSIGSTRINISDKIKVAGYQTTWKNVNIQFSNRNLTITLTVNSFTSQYPVLMIEALDTNTSLVAIDKVFTIACKGHAPDGCNLRTLKSNSIQYYDRHSNTEAVSIANFINSTSKAIQVGTFNGPTTAKSGDTYTFTITDTVLYEGAYTNPPFCKSITQLNNEGLMDLLKPLQKYSFEHFLCPGLANVNNSRRYRLFKIGTKNSNRSFCYDFFIRKNLAVQIHSIAKVKIRWLTGAITEQYPPTGYNYFLKAEGYKDTASSSTRMVSFQITYDSDLNVYLSVTVQNAAASSLSIFSLGGFSTSGSDNYISLQDCFVYDAQANTTDSVLYSTDVSYPSSGNDII